MSVHFLLDGKEDSPVSIENKTPFVSAVIVAAGSSSRMGGVSKQFLDLCGQPVLVHTLRAFQAATCVDEIVVVTKAQDIERICDFAERYGIKKCSRVVPGGDSRQASVACGLECLSADAAFVAIHDGARPLITPQGIDKTIQHAFLCGACTVGTSVVDTIKKADENLCITETPDRSTLYAVQTPQVFEIERYRSALKKASEDGRNFTDDCQLLEYAGFPVTIIAGKRDNIKITTPEDMAIAKALLEFRKGGAE